MLILFFFIFKLCLDFVKLVEQISLFIKKLIALSFSIKCTFFQLLDTGIFGSELFLGFLKFSYVFLSLGQNVKLGSE